MRKIKFRMFDTEEKVFMYYSRVIESSLLDLSKEGRFIYQQFTGLVDKNGTEIYEGDIVELLYAAASEDEKAQVLWRDGEAAFMLWADYQVKRHLGSLVSSELKVIGNIYQTPELAK